MNLALVAFLVLLWAVVLLPGALRSRRSDPSASAAGFEAAMDVLRRNPDRAPEGGRYLMVPGDARAVADPRARRQLAVLERRRRTFTLLVGTAGLSTLAAFVGGGRLWLLVVASLGALGVYTSMLLRLKAQRDEAAAVVRSLPDRTIDLSAHERLEHERERIPVAVGAGGYAGDGLQVASRPDEPWQPQAGVRIRRWDA